MCGYQALWRRRAAREGCSATRRLEMEVPCSVHHKVGRSGRGNRVGRGAVADTGVSGVIMLQTSFLHQRLYS
jgi:hypothetical protein